VTAAATTVVVPAQPGPPPDEQADARSRWQLVEAAQAGDRDAFAALYERYHSHVLNMIWRRTSNRHLAEDLAHDVFVRALRSLDSVTWQGRDIGAWFATVARNLVIDHFKSGRYRLETTAGLLYDEDRHSDRADRTPEGDPAGTVADQMLHVELRAAVDRLGPEQREVIVRRFYDGLSVAETAAAMGKQDGAIKALQYRAVRTLARLLPSSIADVWSIR
jgi:RNA polymerase sigma-70 factor, ECF subfamily